MTTKETYEKPVVATLPARCDSCGTVFNDAEVAIEPLVDASVAQLLVPYATRQALYSALYRYKDVIPPKYRRDKSGRRIRVLTPSEIRFLRSRVLVPYRRTDCGR